MEILFTVEQGVQSVNKIIHQYVFSAAIIIIYLIYIMESVLNVQITVYNVIIKVHVQNAL